MNYQVGMISLGCSKNQVDAERMLSLLSENGFTICSDPARCDAIIVNTCGFIEDAKRESIESIFEAAQQKKGRLKVLAVTGCLAERYQNEFADEVPEADVILGMGSIGEIAASLRCALEKGERVISFREKSDLPLEGERILANEPYFAYLKVAEGCDNRCAFCAIPDIRGHFRSMPMEKVLEEARRLADRGVVELNVVAQDTTRYGQDLYGKLMLPELLRELCKIEKIRWVRLLYCYPDRTTEDRQIYRPAASAYQRPPAPENEPQGRFVADPPAAQKTSGKDSRGLHPHHPDRGPAGGNGGGVRGALRFCPGRSV